ncbi:hypothetical protein FN846DRAFT_892428 [Sphaerosporella brunnea]|uniref:Uncharacterized protein n=1 Tax=Sphaerosporella brunnea TaxID=1250544 RepID=A0A5J5EQJ6_9PEZI|nr:hypothetical protein FN846DRAFT_892428 [Sphaerosporella brunnea]
MHPLNRQRVLTHSQLALLFRKHPTSPPPRGDLRPLPHCVEKSMTVVPQIASREPTTMEEAQEVIKDLSSEGQSLNARLGIREAELKQVLSRKRPSKSSRKVLSDWRFAVQKPLQEAWVAREPPPPKLRKANGKGKAKAAHPAAAKGKRRARRGGDVIEVQDSEVEREVCHLADDSEMEVEEKKAEKVKEAEEVERRRRRWRRWRRTFHLPNRVGMRCGGLRESGGP